MKIMLIIAPTVNFGRVFHYDSYYFISVVEAILSKVGTLCWDYNYSRNLVHCKSIAVGNVTTKVLHIFN